MEENKISILATKLLAPEQLARAAAVGIRIDCLPFIQTVAVAPEVLLDSIGPLTLQEKMVVFTSARAVKAVAAALGQVSPSWTIACLEGATLQAVQQQLAGMPLLETAPDAGILALKLVRRDHLHEVVFCCGDLSLPVLRQTLESGGVRVHEVVAYRTSLTPVRVTSPYDGILFFSPSAVESYFSLNPAPPANTVFFTIGRTTAAALSAYPNSLRVAASPHPGAVINEVIHYFNPALDRSKLL